MGLTRFSGVVGDSFAAGGALKSAPMHNVPSAMYRGFSMDGSTLLYTSTGASGVWAETAIGVSTPSISTTTDGGINFNSHNATTLNLGASWLHGGTGAGTSAYHKLFAASSTSYPSENGIEIFLRQGGTTGNSFVHATTFGFFAAGAGAQMTTAGALSPSTNLACFHLLGDGSSSASIIAKAAGSSGGVVTAATDTTLQSTYNVKYLYLGIRILGFDKIEWYFNRRLFARTQLATPINSTRLCMGLGNVSLTTSTAAQVVHARHISGFSTADPADVTFNPASL